ncbi:MAG: hypothetical protein ACM3XS_04455 [Bacteroidota bacterium]
MNPVNMIGGVLLLLAAAFLASFAKLAIVPLLALILLSLVGLLTLFGADDKARALAGKWWGILCGWFAGKGGWPLWEAAAIGILFFGLFAGVPFLARAAAILAALIAPWLAGLWASRRRTQWPALLSALAGAVVGVVEGRHFLAWLPADWREFPASLLVTILAGLAGAALGFWACARGRFKVEADLRGLKREA